MSQKIRYGSGCDFPSSTASFEPSYQRLSSVNMAVLVSNKMMIEE